MASPTINWQDYVKYCGSGVMPYRDADSVDHHTGRHSESAPLLPAGTRLSLVPSYKITPAERAGIREGDVVTHARTASGWEPVTHFMAFTGAFKGPVLSTVDVRVVSADGTNPRVATVQKEWIVYIPPNDPLRQLYPDPSDLRAVVAANLENIRNRDREDDACELIASVTPSDLMKLVPTLPRLAQTGTAATR